MQNVDDKTPKKVVAPAFGNDGWRYHFLTINKATTTASREWNVLDIDKAKAWGWNDYVARKIGRRPLTLETFGSIFRDQARTKHRALGEGVDCPRPITPR